MKRLLLYCALLASQAEAADIYSYKDANGNTVFTDRPRVYDSKPLAVPPSNGIAAPPPTPMPSKPLHKPLARYQSLQLLAPANDATLRELSGDVLVTLASDPPLMGGHAYRLLMDGQPLAPLSSIPSFTLKNVDRGSHKLVAQILDEQHRVLETTPTVVFHLQRTSLAQKRKARPCQKDDYGVRPECPLKDKPAEEKSSILPFF